MWFLPKSGSSFKASICKISMQILTISCRCQYFACRYAWCLAYQLPLMQDPENHLKMKTAADLSLHSSALSGKIKTAVTHYHTLSSQDWSLITLKLDAGRTHRSVSIWHPQDITQRNTLYHSDDKISSCASFQEQPSCKFLFSILSEIKCSFWKHHYLSIFVNWFHFQV